MMQRKGQRRRGEGKKSEVEMEDKMESQSEKRDAKKKKKIRFRHRIKRKNQWYTLCVQTVHTTDRHSFPLQYKKEMLQESLYIQRRLRGIPIIL